ncbi:MAG: transporter substrate-binding domain-containing protein [Candidimonas sp.]|jgi:lysine-arginine-ornithine-binding protein
MKKWILAGLIAAMTSSWAQAETLTVGEQCTYPPFNYRDAAGELKGFEIDVANEIGKRIGAEIAFSCLSFDAFIPALLARKLDIVVSSLSITEARKKSVDFSIPYRVSAGRFVAHKDANIEPVNGDGTANTEALKGKVVGVQRSTTNDTYLAGEFEGVEIARYDSAENLLLDLVAGRIDLALIGALKAQQDFLDQPEGKDFAFVGPDIDIPKYFGEGVGVAMRKGNDDLRDRIDKALESMFADGTMEALNKKYWSINILPSKWNWQK